MIDDVAKEVLRRQMWQVADFCGVQPLTYTIMNTHFHVVLRVPEQQPVSDTELLRRYSVLYPSPTAWQTAQLAVIRSELETNGDAAVRWRERQLRLMGDVSQYMKLLKQRFSIWFNKTRNRWGPVWGDRFTSVLMGPEALVPLAAYVDLNSVRAGIVVDPMNYPFCGYAEALAGNEAARTGLKSLFEESEWSAMNADYRKLLFGIGGAPREGAAVIPLNEVRRVLDEGGRLPLATMLRCRIRYFTRGAVLGSRAFVAAHIASPLGARNRRSGPHPLPDYTDWGELATLRRVRERAIA